MDYQAQARLDALQHAKLKKLIKLVRLKREIQELEEAEVLERLNLEIEQLAREQETLQDPLAAQIAALVPGSYLRDDERYG